MNSVGLTVPRHQQRILKLNRERTGEDLDRGDIVRLDRVTVRLDDGQGMLINAELEVRVTAHRDQPEAVTRKM